MAGVLEHDLKKCSSGPEIKRFKEETRVPQVEAIIRAEDEEIGIQMLKFKVPKRGF